MSRLVLLSWAPVSGPPVRDGRVASRVRIVGLLLRGDKLDEGLGDLLASGLLDGLEAVVVKLHQGLFVADLESPLRGGDDRGRIIIEATSEPALAPRPFPASGVGLPLTIQGLVDASGAASVHIIVIIVRIRGIFS